ncbi:unnamed protein product, partial [Polarella glacialis]
FDRDVVVRVNGTEVKRVFFQVAEWSEGGTLEVAMEGADCQDQGQGSNLVAVRVICYLIVASYCWLLLLFCLFPTMYIWGLLILSSCAGLLLSPPSSPPFLSPESGKALVLRGPENYTRNTLLP